MRFRVVDLGPCVFVKEKLLLHHLVLEQYLCVFDELAAPLPVQLRRRNSRRVLLLLVLLLLGLTALLFLVFL